MNDYQATALAQSVAEPISLAAQAVLNAANLRWEGIDDDIPAQVAAAALRAAADRMMGLIGDIYHPKYLEAVEASADFLEKIAAELEGQS
jgi:hypothetical protein